MSESYSKAQLPSHATDLTEAQLAVAGLTARFCAGRRWPRRARRGAQRRIEDG